MVTLYKLNNNNNVSWWTIEPHPRGYKVSWGQDHNNRSVSKNEQITDGDLLPSPVEEQIQSCINEMIARRGYSRDVPTAVPDLPMLAQTYKDFVRLANSSQSTTNHFEKTYLQPKLDGVRCLATCISLKSRRNTLITSCPHIEEFLEYALSCYPELGTLKFDGELWIPGSDLQTTQSAVARREHHPTFIRVLHYHVFDLVHTSSPFEERLHSLQIASNLIAQAWESFEPTVPHWYDTCPIQFVSTYECGSTLDDNFQTTLTHHHSQFVNNGYEGTIIRNAHGLYRPNYRSYDLLKYKDFMDGEFEVVDVLLGKNQCGIFLCKTSTGKHFRVSPAYTTSRKRQILRYKENYIGKMLTVKYERLSKEGVPLKPIGHSIRQAL